MKDQDVEVGMYQALELSIQMSAQRRMISGVIALMSMALFVILLKTGLEFYTVTFYVALLTAIASAVASFQCLLSHIDLTQTRRLLGS